jgi:hypothetical protein
MERSTNKERTEELMESGALTPRYVTEEGLAVQTSIPAKTFRNERVKTPKRRSVEQIKKALASGEFFGPTFIEVGGKRIYDLRDADEWMALFPKRGILPPDIQQALKEEMTE